MAERRVDRLNQRTSHQRILGAGVRLARQIDAQPARTFRTTHQHAIGGAGAAGQMGRTSHRL